MAASSSSLINIWDPNHAFAPLTRLNHRSYLFKNVPLEIRLIIYEYATAIDKPVQPRQVASRSNKFIWGKPVDPRANPITGAVLKTNEEPLAVVSLSRTCRSIYRELEDNPVFYRVNRFEFYTAYDFHSFLAAILPKRLAMIRTICLITGECQSVWSEDWSGQRWALPHVAPQSRGRHRRRSSNIGHILALLSRCNDLRELSLILQQNTHGDMEFKLYGWDTLADGSHEAPAFINLPIFDVFMRFSIDGEEFHLKNALDRIEFQQGPEAMHYISAVVRGLEARKKAFALKGKSHEEEDNEDNRPQWLKDLANETAINAAIKAATVDFVGGNRIAQDMHLMSDSVSSRTRRKGQVVNSLGVVHREIPKYNEDGILSWNYSKITGIRWNNSREIELELFWQYPPRDPESSWESFHALPKDRRGEENIIRFFQEAEFWKIEDLGDLVRKLRSVPTPSEIAEFAGGLDQFLDKDTMFAETGTHAVRQTRIRSWTHWGGKWDRLITRLDKMLAKKEKEAAKAAKAAMEDLEKAQKGNKGTKKAKKIATKKTAK